MASKWQVDNETKYPLKDETDKQRFERLRKRVAWELELTKEDQKFYELEIHPIKKELLESKKNANPNETPEEKKARLKELAKKKEKHFRVNHSFKTNDEKTPQKYKKTMFASKCKQLYAFLYIIKDTPPLLFRLFS